MCLLSLGCSSGVGTSYPTDAVSLETGPPDSKAFSTCPRPVPDLCLGICTSTLWDLENCGACGHTCTRSDNCASGSCRCGPYDPCTPPAECVNSTCLVPDHTGRPCEDDGYCEKNQSCVGGYCTSALCTPEKCDGYDNDCNGLIDDPPLYLARVCYEGPTSTLNVGQCIAGLSLCLAGRYGPCEGQIIPVPESGILGCDGADQDCDGCADNHYGIDGECIPPPPTQYDILVYIDYSGSMGSYIYAMTAAVEELSSSFAGNDNYHWALIGIHQRDSDGQVTVINDLAEYSLFSAALSSEGTTTAGGSCEPSRAGVYLGSTGALPLTYRPSAVRAHIVLSDEGAQVCSSTTGVTTTELELCAQIIDTGQLLVVVTEPYHFSDWDACSLSYPMTSAPSALADNLEEALGEACSL